MESPNDLRYETLIKIISSASVGCRGAYTTASRECNDLNGNNSVKDGCSRPCKYVAGASMPPLPAFRSARIGRKKGRGNTTGRRNGRAPVTSSFGLWIPTSDDDYNTGDKNVGCEDKNSRETREPERSKCSPSLRGMRVGREPVAISPSLPREKKVNAALLPEQNMAHVASRGTIPGREQPKQELHSLSTIFLFLSARYTITERATFPSSRPHHPPNRNRRSGESSENSSPSENSRCEGTCECNWCGLIFEEKKYPTSNIQEKGELNNW